MDKELQDIRDEIASSMERARSVLEELKRRLNHNCEAVDENSTFRAGLASREPLTRNESRMIHS
jgi:hypothetical protein